VAEVAQGVDDGAGPDARLTERAPVDGGVGADDHPVLDDDDAALGDPVMAALVLDIAEAVATDDGQAAAVHSHAGADRRPITPALEGRVWLAGFQPNRPAVGVQDHLCARMQWNMGRAAQCRHGRRPQGDRAGYRLRTARSSEGTDQVAREVGCRETKEKAEQGPDNHVFDLLPAGACADVAEPEQGLCCKEKANERRKRECFVKSMAKWVMSITIGTYHSSQSPTAA